jgi:hypothetical protein
MYAATFAASAPDRAAIVMGSGEVVTCRGARRALQPGRGSGVSGIATAPDPGGPDR